jgi:hypothetical protein
MESALSIPTLERLCDHVRHVLCERDRLDPTQTPMHRTLIRRGGKACGLFFQVQGPRRVRTFAVWAGEENRILFYDSAGARFAESRLSEAPDPRALD